MDFKQIASYDNFMLANMTMGLLTENEIKCQLKDENIVTMDPLLNAAVGGIKLLVEEKDYAKAVALIKDAEDAYVKDIACPNCKVHALTVEEKINNPLDFWGKLITRYCMDKLQPTAKITAVQIANIYFRNYRYHFKLI